MHLKVQYIIYEGVLHTLSLVATFFFFNVPNKMVHELTAKSRALGEVDRIVTH